MQPFWMICRAPRRPDAETAPRARYATRASAEQAARQLAAKTGEPFTILEAVQTVYPGAPGTDDLFATR
ncbi:hypothetical protein [Roseivivax isoporae]|uniref:Uncharacterized protein n=1 Tax=Roseivivax isoporae LMG 25204 TaxID=1449351 RepID=X7F1P0_9RHOB|nr:hypothetical protein [Roseivivax isoporae]ETX26695.1 hypothetical protein RISW2_20685 [Roseivivax isoporae LMG 25204]